MPKEKKNIKNFRKGKKDYRDPKSKKRELGGDGEPKKEFFSDNDMKWYSLNKGLVEASGRLPFGRPTGNSVQVDVATVTTAGNISNTSAKLSVPGIMSFAMCGSVGCNLDNVQSIDVAAKSIYSYVRHANSGHANYDSPDLMLYLLAAREIYAACGFMMRTLALANTFSATNRYYGSALLKAHFGGISADWVFDNIADLRYYISNYFLRAASVYTPKGLPMFEKAFWIYTQIYEEDKTNKSGIYLYNPDGFYKFNATKYPTGGCLEYMPLGITSLSGFKTYFNSLLDAIISDEDMGIMSGDIKKAYDSKIWALPAVPLEATIKPIHDSFVLQQMHNVNMCPVDDAKMDIVQDNTTNEILWFPQAISSANFKSSYGNVDASNAKTTIIDIDSEVPSTDEVIEATQYKCKMMAIASSLLTSGRMLTYSNITGYVFTANKTPIIFGAGDFICRRVAIFQYELNSSNQWVVVEHTLHHQIMSDTAADSPMTVIETAQMLGRVAAFEFAPFIYNCSAYPLIGPVHNYTFTKWEVIDNIHDACWLSLLAIPAQDHM